MSTSNLSESLTQKPVTTSGANSKPENNLALNVLLQEGGRLTFGTCSHCVVSEPTRPQRAWDVDPERSELDFDQATIFAALAELGVQVQIEEEYCCP